MEDEDLEDSTATGSRPPSLSRRRKEEFVKVMRRELTKHTGTGDTHGMPPRARPC